MANYAPPVDQLLTLGEPIWNSPWQDYRQLGLTAEHVPELIRMMQDTELNDELFGGDEIYAPLHAWRALAQLRAAEAVRPMLELIEEFSKQDELIIDDSKEFFGLIGPAASPMLIEWLTNPRHGLDSRWAAVAGLTEIAERYPETRAECIEVLRRQLQHGESDNRTFNAALVEGLVHHRVQEAAPEIEQAFAAGMVNESLTGNWEWVSWDLGLRPSKPSTPRYPDIAEIHSLLEELERQTRAENPAQKARDKSKAKRKAAAKARKRNRKKK